MVKHKRTKAYKIGSIIPHLQACQYKLFCHEEAMKAGQVGASWDGVHCMKLIFPPISYKQLCWGKHE